MASSGVPYSVLERVFTSQATRARRSTMTMSISPSAHRQFRASIRKPACCRYSAASCSPCLPSASLAFNLTTSGSDVRGAGARPMAGPAPCGGQGGGGGDRGYGRRTVGTACLNASPQQRPAGPNLCGVRPRRQAAAAAPGDAGRRCEGGPQGRGGTQGPRKRPNREGSQAAEAVRPRRQSGRGGAQATGALRQRVRSGKSLLLVVRVRELKVALSQFLNVDVLEGDYPNVLHEPRRAVHIPHPGVLHGDLEEHLAVVRGVHIELNLIGEVEPALGLDHMTEQPDHIAVLAVELQLHLCLVLLEILRAHLVPSVLTARVLPADRPGDTAPGHCGRRRPLTDSGLGPP